MKQAQPLGQRMDQARARFRRGEKAMEALQRRKRLSSKRSRRWFRLKWTWTSSCRKPHCQ